MLKDARRFFTCQSLSPPFFPFLSSCLCTSVLTQLDLCLEQEGFAEYLSISHRSSWSHYWCKLSPLHLFLFIPLFDLNMFFNRNRMLFVCYWCYTKVISVWNEQMKNPVKLKEQVFCINGQIQSLVVMTFLSNFCFKTRSNKYNVDSSFISLTDMHPLTTVVAGLIHPLLQIKSTWALELECLFVSSMVSWSCDKIWNSLSCKVRFFFFVYVKVSMHERIHFLDAWMACYHCYVSTTCWWFYLVSLPLTCSFFW